MSGKCKECLENPTVDFACVKCAYLFEKIKELKIDMAIPEELKRIMGIITI